MFHVNRSDKHLVRLEQTRFADERLCERDDLQEWLARTPEALGEELLIAQKEFDGFADTRERLDLLALDKEGRLVIIEIKRDDSGCDVVWQALKYVAYCSSLTKTQIVEVFQKYLDGCFAGASAVTKLCEFLDIDELDEVVLNADNEQRLVLVAGNFRKEVTAAVLWLLGHGVRAQCFRVVPYSFRGELLIDFRQVIPTPEAAGYMIRMAVKDSEKKSAQDAQKQIHERHFAFWTRTLEELCAHDVSRFASINPSKEHWLSCATGVSGCNYALVFLKRGARVEVILQRSVAAENKWFFDRLEEEKEPLERLFGNELRWQRMDERKLSRISISHRFDGTNVETWPSIIDWLREQFVRLDQAFSEPLDRLNKELKSAGDTLPGGPITNTGSASTD